MSCLVREFFVIRPSRVRRTNARITKILPTDTEKCHEQRMNATFVTMYYVSRFQHNGKKIPNCLRSKTRTNKRNTIFTFSKMVGSILCKRLTHLMYIDKCYAIHFNSTKINKS